MEIKRIHSNDKYRIMLYHIGSAENVGLGAKECIDILAVTTIAIGYSQQLLH
ncbi:hypothetical protein CXF71_07030 [Colwellia sp. 12G3]|nr:hypothetical protein CXF71_07030 [Colwellia sp. 12G3]